MDINELKRVGSIIELEGQPYIVLESQHARTAQRRAFVRTKLKNLISGVTMEKTFNAGDQVKEADVERAKANYLYQDDHNVYLMNMTTYEQLGLNKSILAGKEKYLKDGQEVIIVLFNQNPINIELPKKVELKVVDAPPGVRGDSATNIMKQITLETGLKVNAPLFIKENDVLRINTETGEYVERV
ncbi:MAG: elongation factor P [Patescibacteria group bacterium]|nr:elongation factor P [Patescibacteria group bacterium]MDD5121255.1 elongation factor P [Patescibacteria group bacterium]MDD5222167.1 elongation factor P [Patescibacteria group bacterium]MDD5395826.1 elongation factor P [Patescibacteria group bacterium]